MKVTYERLICARNIIKTYYESMCDELGYSDDKDTLNDELSIIDELIEQHNTPTWEEVVKVWEDALGECKVTLNNDEVKVLMLNLRKYLIKKDHVYSDRTVYSMNKAILNAINLTIRYLEAQKEKEDE